MMTNFFVMFVTKFIQNLVIRVCRYFFCIYRQSTIGTTACNLRKLNFARLLPTQVKFGVACTVAIFLEYILLFIKCPTEIVLGIKLDSHIILTEYGEPCA